MRNFYIVGGNRYGEVFVLTKYGFTQVDSMEEADFVVFTGGQDINPAIYGEVPHPHTGYSSTRDKSEIAAYNKAKELNKAFLGICRGAQLLNCLVGGSLFQHINHPSYHEIVTDDGERFMSNSIHHQMLRVTEGAIIKAWAENLSNTHQHMVEGQIVDVKNVEREPEIVIYPEHRMVLVQGHPEFYVDDPELERFRQYTLNLVKEI